MCLPGVVWTMIAASRRERTKPPRIEMTPVLGRTGVVVGAMEGYSAVTVPFMSGWIAQMNG